MDESMASVGASVVFMDEPLALIHIPLEIYPFFLQPILKALFGPESFSDEINNLTLNGTCSHWTFKHVFMNISITPVECSVVCSRDLASNVFLPAINQFDHFSTRDVRVTISTEDFIAIQVEGPELPPDQRVLELTSPLALAGISIFFITTYFSDYILVPKRAKAQVIHALQKRGLIEKEDTEGAFVTKSSSNQQHHRNQSSTSSAEVHPVTPSTPPPKTVPELQLKTFARLKEAAIVPTAYQDLHLIHCAAPRDFHTEPMETQMHLKLGLFKVLTTASPPPSLFSITLSHNEAASLLMEKRLRPLFGPDGALLGSDQNVLVPIVLDLRTLPFESTGIVCGISGRLATETAQNALEMPVEIRFLSTARAGTVVVEQGDLERAMKALEAVEGVGVE